MGLVSRSMTSSGTLTFHTVAACKAPLLWRFRNFFVHRLPDLPRIVVARFARFMGVPIMTSVLRARVKRASGEWVDFGILSTRIITTVGVNFIVDAFQNTVEVELLKYHGVGTGTTAENVADTALQTECTTALNPDSTRATGSTTEGATANIYRTVGTPAFDASAAITEHGIFNQAATGGGTLLDRSVFTAINVISGDGIQFTYELTFTAGG